ncbi:RNA polymerase sigma factor [Candidatus Soleaferrea massiliensis]|uniref:RNA polymerase sigma factor n=1 Tax=Candidatus Soleaferrea massiliensis TaxID=1470354 RepID=UPI00058C8CF9|nr:sigma-70 family RNA polymerase sigma factor [Candidatus Soleaferrea massiliensis]
MSKEYYIELNGKRIPVSEEVYYAFKRPAWRERKRRQVRSDNELSLNALADDGFEVPDEAALVDEIVEDKLLLDMLFKALAELTDDERFLIDALFYQEKSERMVAKEIGVSQNTVNYHKNRLLDKLRKLIEKNF